MFVRPPIEGNGAHTKASRPSRSSSRYVKSRNPAGPVIASSPQQCAQALNSLPDVHNASRSSRRWSRPNPPNVVGFDSEVRQIVADLTRDTRIAQVGVVLFRHPRVGMPKRLGNEGHRNAFHRQQAAIGVTQDMKRDRRIDVRRLAGRSHGSLLMRLLPGTAIGALEHALCGCPSRRAAPCDIPGRGPPGLAANTAHGAA
jgi:hypothetical protein